MYICTYLCDVSPADGESVVWAVAFLLMPARFQIKMRRFEGKAVNKNPSRWGYKGGYASNTDRYNPL